MAGGDGVGPDALRAMQRVTGAVVAERPEVVNAGASIAELAYVWGAQRATAGDGWRHRIWWDGDDPTAWGWARPEEGRTRLLWQAHPDRTELLDEVLDWFDDVAAGTDRITAVRAGDAEAAGRLEGHGYAYAPDDPGAELHAMDLHDVERPELDEGYALLTAGQVTPEEVVAAHVAAWPSSTFGRRGHAGLREAPPYREDLHVLLRAPDGTLVSSAVLWYDEPNRTGQFVPVGTHRGHRRRGFARAVLLHGMARAKEVGAEHLLAGCPAGQEAEGARKLYRSVGFHQLSRDLTHVKRASSPRRSR